MPAEIAAAPRHKTSSRADTPPLRWIGKNYKWAGEELWQSLDWYATHILRELVIGELRDAAPDASLYGGIVRKTLRAMQFRDRRVQNCKSTDELYTARFSRDCFVAPSTDLDVYFSCKDNIETFVVHMKERGFLVQDVFRDLGEGGHPSHDMVLRRVSVEPTVQLVGPRTFVMMDLSAPAGASRSTRVRAPDFSANTMQQSLKDLSVSVRSWNMDGVRSTDGGKPRSQDGYWAARQLKRVLDQVDAGETTLYLLSWGRYQELSWGKGASQRESKKELREEYLEYVSAVLDVRLRKMLRQGWTVTNLLLPTSTEGRVLLQCGEVEAFQEKEQTAGASLHNIGEDNHAWEAGGQWRIRSGRVELKCPRCQEANVAFDDWI